MFIVKTKSKLGECLYKMTHKPTEKITDSLHEEAEETPRSLSELIEDTIATFTGENIFVDQNNSKNSPTDTNIEKISEDSASNEASNSEDGMSDKLSFRSIVEAFHERGFGMLLLILGAPMALPLPVPPGVNIILASPLLFLTAQQAFGKKSPWLPEFLLSKNVKRTHFQKTMLGILPWIKRIEKFSKPRLGFITHGVFSYLIGLSGFIMALSVCVPLPLTNSVPSLGICLMAVGVLMRDGLSVIAGMVIGFSWITLLIFLGEAGLRYIVGLII